MNYISQIRENIACPQFGDNHYGKWSCLRIEQRRAYYYLITLLNSSDSVIKSKYREIKRLNKEIERLKEENEKVHKELDYADNYNIYLISRIDKAIEVISKELLCYDNESDEYIQGKKVINILNGGDENDN